jgi:hypothetical protein
MQDVGRSVKVFWANKCEWHPGIIDDYHPTKGYHVAYDGEDEFEEWLQTLKDVQFEGTEGSVHDDKLTTNSFRHGAFDYRSGPLPHDADEVSDDFIEDRSVLSISELTESGILLKGGVTGANNLPGDTLGQSEGVFYRVLYSEGSQQSAMFACKTPIFRSELSGDLRFPSWDISAFRFEMVLPSGMNTPDFSRLGQFLIVLYRARQNGGSEFIGQLALNIADFVNTGTVWRARPGCECRVLRGSYVLQDRHGGMVGDADLDLDMRCEWRVAPAASNHETTKVHKTTGGGSVATKTTKSANARPKSANASVAGSSRASRTTHTHRKDHKQSVVDKQNEAMRLRLEKAGPSKIAGQDRVGVIREVYKSTQAERTKKASADANMKKPSGDVKISPRPGTAREGGAASQTTSFSKKPYNELLSMYQSLHERHHNVQKEGLKQKAQVSKLKALVSASIFLTSRQFS